uniref:ArsR family transcriptional regulator n=1 Tax=Archaeoglobus fulgidus TaxID=2234 RepID=A0A7J2THX9_ARCFL
MDRLLEKRKLALLSERKLEILKKLNGRRMTLSELSKELEISKSSVKGHLNKLVDAELIRRLNEGRKWIYYKLTDKGRKALYEESRKSILMLILSILSILIGISMAKISAPDLRLLKEVKIKIN